MIELLNGWSHSWAGYFGLAVVQNTLFLGLIFFILRIIRHTPAQLKYIVALTGLFKLILPPFIPGGMFVSVPMEFSSLPFISSGLAFANSPEVAGAGNGFTPSLSFASLLFSLWAGLAIIYLVITAVSSLRLSFILRDVTELPFDVTTNWMKGSSAQQTIGVFQSKAITMPLTYGLFPKRIYVPTTWSRWSTECREMIFRHELAHIRRHDGFFKGFQFVVQAIYLFHPLVWLLNQRINEYREMACDDASVLSTNDSRITYSKTLVEIAESIAWDSCTYETASALIRRKNELLARVKYQMKEGVMRQLPKMKTVFLMAFLVFLTVSLSWYSGDATPGTSPKDGASAGSVTAKSTQHVKVLSQDNILVNGEKTTYESFVDKMKSIAELDPETAVIKLDCDDDVPMKKLVEIQKFLMKMNLNKIMYRSTSTPAMPLVLPNEDVEARMKRIPKEDIADLWISATGTVTIEGKETPLSSIKDEIQHRLDQNEHLIVSIHFESTTKYIHFVTVLNQVKKGNAQSIFINTVTE